jgi:pimeloyl-ACP methyl ester carboxylesterase
MKSSVAKRTFSLALLAAVPASFAIAGALVYCRYRRDIRAARARVSSGSKLAKTPSGVIEYADVGTGAPVFVIHGAGGGFDQGLEFAQHLIDAGFRVIAPSRFGYLRTPLPQDASPIAQADAHARLLDALRLEEVAVVGISAGAPSAMQLCLRHPERCTALVLAVPLVYSGIPAGAAPSALRKFLINMAISSDFIFWAMSKLARNTMFRTVLGTPPQDVEKAGAEEQARITEVLDHIEPISQRKKGLQNETAIARSLPRYDLEHLQVPTLVSSIEDCLYNTYPGACYTAKNIPGARFLGYPTGGHLAVGHETELWSEVRQFLQTAA